MNSVFPESSPQSWIVENLHSSPTLRAGYISTVLFAAGTPDVYAVPRHSDVTSVTLKLWGAGGGGVLTPASAAIVGETGTSNATQGTSAMEIALYGDRGVPQSWGDLSPVHLYDVFWNLRFWIVLCR